ncbi:MAG TPA: hypothetical protein VMT57_07070 [Candidatus Thermoplasmatota archaeon]|nr:hypothetical protein [Candidatus Thermoplasmatota archaeon]
MTTQIPSMKKLMSEIRDSRDKEAFRQLEKTPGYRIGIGVRQEETGEMTFYLELLLNLSKKTDVVSVPRLENIVRILKALQARIYSLSYLDGTNCITCEIILPYQKLSSEFTLVKSLIRTYI